MPKPLTLSESQALHKDSSLTGAALTNAQRQQFIQLYLPPARSSVSKPSHKHTSSPGLLERRPRLRPALAHLLHVLVFHLIQFVFTIYIHTRRAHHALSSYIYSILYYHHRSPELIQRDVRNVSRLPQHLSIIVDLASEDASEPAEGLEKLIGDVAEVAAWCACAGIRMLSIYERTGALKSHMAGLDHVCRATMRSYYPPEHAPKVTLRAPSQQFSPGGSRSPSPNPPVINGDNHGVLDLLLLSAQDGRETLVDLTKTLSEMAQKRKLSPSDITTELIDAEITESSFAEPDLLVVMAPSPVSSLIPRRRKRRRSSGHRHVHNISGRASAESEKEEVLNGGGGEICLRGYPPWQARLTEIFYVKDGRGIEYRTFLRALHRFAKAEMRFGR